MVWLLTFVSTFTILNLVYGYNINDNSTYCQAPHFKAEYICSTERDPLSPPIDLRDDSVPVVLP